MAENYVTGYDNFITYCERLSEICKFKCNEKAPFYKALSSQKIDGNTPEQMKEEIAKAKQILNGLPRNDGNSWENIIIDAEKYAFFKGAIRFLFTDENGRVNDESWDNFDKKWENAKKYFDENGVREEYKVQLTKALVIQCDDWEKQLYKKEIYNPNDSTWKWILCADNWTTPINNILIKELNEIKKTTINNDSNIQTLITPLLDKLPFEDMMKKVPNGRFRRHGHLAFYNNKSNVIVFDWDNFHRNKILVQLMDNGIISVYNERSSIFFWGWNINFNYKYKGSGYSFQWLGRPNEKELDVYFMEKADYKKRRNPTSDKGTDEDIYYCFRVTKDMESDPSKFTDALDELIKKLQIS